MGLITKAIHIADGAWITTRCIVLGGSQIGVSAIISPGTVVKTGQVVPNGAILGSASAQIIGQRFTTDSTLGSESDTIDD
jgi:putative colanic acid biosynthesis acetyltransferase WcaF